MLIAAVANSYQYFNNDIT